MVEEGDGGSDGVFGGGEGVVGEDGGFEIGGDAQ